MRNSDNNRWSNIVFYMKEEIWKVSFYGIAAILTGILAFFIMYNAGWIIGDDAIVISHTGWGHFFNPADTVTPSSGRFFPLAYTVYNILPLLGLTSVNAHFALQTIVFVLFCIISIWAARKAIDAKQLAWHEYLLIFSAGMVCIARAYNNFLDAYSTVWVDYFLVMLWVLCCYYVHECQSLVAMTIGLLSVTWLTYCLETNFVFPLAYGIAGLIFIRENATKLEKAYHWSLVSVGVIFLLLYFFICYLHIEEAYDGSHGVESTIIGNAIKMFIAQKVLWVVLILLCWRAYHIVIKKDEFEFWDTMLLTGCAYCCGCAVLKLNWVLYYSLASLFMIPAIVHYLHKYVGSKWALMIMLALALFTFRKVLSYIKTNQNDRQETAKIISILTTYYHNGICIYWYAPEDEREWDFHLDQREWQYVCTQTLFAWHVEEECYKFPKIKEFEGESGIYILPKENNELFPEYNSSIISKGEVLKEDGRIPLSVVRIE